VAEPDWARWLRPGDRLVCSHMSSEPATLLASLAGAAPGLGLRVMLGVPFSSAAQALPADCELLTYGGMGSASALMRSHAVRISPLPYSRSAEVYESGAWACDVALLSLARDARGGLWLGASHGPALAAARRARHVIAQVNASAPCVPGAPWPEDLRLDAVMETDHAPAPYQETPPDAVEQAIGQHIAALVPDGACLQMGIGSVPSAALAALRGHRHLGVHSGMVSDAVLDLIEAGVIDHSRKTRDAGVAVVGAVVGSERLYRFADGNPSIALRDPAATHGLATVAAQAGFFSLNSAIEVDLLGHVNAETVPTADGRWRVVGGQGGLGDFVRAAVAAPRGQSVIALPSRTPRGQPRIVARLGGPCTVAASDVDMIATEHGVARLRDADWATRARAMLAIAHPEDREALATEGRRLGLL